MKPSKYNFYHTQNDRFFIYNQLTGFLSEFDEEMFLAIREGSLPSDIPDGQKQELVRNHFVCDEGLQEELVMLRKNREARYGNRVRMDYGNISTPSIPVRV